MERQTPFDHDAVVRACGCGGALEYDLGIFIRLEDLFPHNALHLAAILIADVILNGERGRTNLKTQRGLLRAGRIPAGVAREIRDCDDWVVSEPGQQSARKRADREPA